MSGAALLLAVGVSLGLAAEGRDGTVRATIDDAKAIGEVSPLIYGGFIEHLGRNVYGGVYDPEDPTADEDGFRKDVIAAMKELAVPCFRYPGGCFTDLWRWEEGVGPRAERPVRLDPAWRQKETNEFGLDEFMKWLGKVGADPILCLNLSTQGAAEAQRLWEYCNFPGGTTMSDRRRKNGREKPYGVRYWCLGNEIWGPWEIGHRPADRYGVDAREAAKAIKTFDAEAKTILSGSDGPDWNETALSIAWEYVDYLSIHQMFNRKRMLPFVRCADRLTRSIKRAAATCEKVRLAKKSEKRVPLAVDEYIFWDGDRRYRAGEDWTKGRHCLEQDYNLRDAVVMGDVMTVFHNHADVVKIACIAQSVNALAPVRTEKGGVLWRQTTFDPIRYASAYGRGTALRLKTEGNEADDVHASVVRRADGSLAVFLVNRGEKEHDFSLVAPGKWRVAESREIAGDPEAVNSPSAQPVRARPTDDVAVGKDGFSVSLKPCSWLFVLLARCDEGVVIHFED